jgi:hypothetical protein
MTLNQPSIRIRCPEDLLAVVPYVCGYHPADGTLAVAGVTGPRLSYVACSDLPEPDLDAEQAADLVAQIAAHTANEESDLVALVAYGPATRVDPIAAAAPAAFAAAGIWVKDMLRVTGDRWWSYLCTNPDCCPPEGHLFDPHSHPLAATAAEAGLVAHPDRAALAAQLAPVTGAARAAMDAATQAARARLARELDQHDSPEQAAAWRAREGAQGLREAITAADDGQPLDDAQAAWLCLLLTDHTVCDLAWAGIDRDPAQLRMWADLTRRAEPALVPAPASLLAFAAWYSGDGVLARVAVQRVLEVEATYPLALLVSHLLDEGVSPRLLDNWPALAATWLDL